MARESLTDIIDQLADWVGVYGAHDNDEPRPRFPPEMHCRICFTGAMQTRITAAVEFDAIMARVTIAPSAKEYPSWFGAPTLIDRIDSKIAGGMGVEAAIRECALWAELRSEVITKLRDHYGYKLPSASGGAVT